MSTINRFLSRRDKHHGAHKDKVMSPPTDIFAPIAGTISPTRCPNSSGYPFLSLSLSCLPPKDSLCLRRGAFPVLCSSADSAAFVLQPKKHGGPLNGLFPPEDSNGSVDKPQKEEDKKVRQINGARIASLTNDRQISSCTTSREPE